MSGVALSSIFSVTCINWMLSLLSLVSAYCYSSHIACLFLFFLYILKDFFVFSSSSIKFSFLIFILFFNCSFFKGPGGGECGEGTLPYEEAKSTILTSG